MKTLRALFVVVLGVYALYPLGAKRVARFSAARRLARLERDVSASGAFLDDVTLAVRLRRLNHLLASWETIGGCGAGGPMAPA